MDDEAAADHSIRGRFPVCAGGDGGHPPGLETRCQSAPTARAARRRCAHTSAVRAVEALHGRASGRGGAYRCPSGGFSRSGAGDAPVHGCHPGAGDAPVHGCHPDAGDAPVHRHHPAAGDASKEEAATQPRRMRSRLWKRDVGLRRPLVPHAVGVRTRVRFEQLKPRTDAPAAGAGLTAVPAAASAAHSLKKRASLHEILHPSARIRSSSAVSGATNTVFACRMDTRPGGAPRGLRTYLRRVQSTATVPDVRALL